MKVTLNWLREFVAIEQPIDRLAERLTMAGLEVEGLTEQGAEPVQVARIVRIDPHPQADHLTVCHVTTGGETIPVVCGATNMQVGDQVALAPEETTLPSGQRVERATIRGQVSCGMLCAEDELGLSADHSGVLILPSDAPLGGLLFPFLGLRDTIIDVAITPNRGDCLSVLGLAREIAALTNVSLQNHKPRVRHTGTPIAADTRVTIVDADLCPRYTARVVKRLQVAPSPPWMKWRLEAAGIRALNNLVDVTNYVMIERGQPLHAFDLTTLTGAEIVVQRARATSTITTLDGKERTLAADDLLICDRERGVAIAGVMGGQNTEVNEQTTTLLLESAYFVPETVRRTARRLGLRSEASYRFERGVDPAGTVAAADRAAALLAQLAGGRVSHGVIDAYPQPLPPVTIPLRAERVAALLGTHVDSPDIERCMRSLGTRTKRLRRDVWQITAPSYRTDLTQEADLVEEVARLRGYDTIPTHLPRVEVRGEKQDIEGEWVKRVRTTLIAQGLTEMLNLSFTSARLNILFPGLVPSAPPLPLLNPLSAEGSEMRLSLLGGLLRALQLNLRQGESGVAAFECGKVFRTLPEQPATLSRQERMTLAGVLYGRWPVTGIGQEGRSIEFTDLKGVLAALWPALRYERQVHWSRASEVKFLHPGQAATLTVDSVVLGLAGALHPGHCAELGFSGTPWVFELDYPTLVHYGRSAVRHQPLPRFPATVRDVAIVADEELPVQTVMDTVHVLEHPLVMSMRLFDLYRGDTIPAGKKSLAYSIAYRAADRTLTTEEVNAIHAQVIKHIVRTLGVEVRT